MAKPVKIMTSIELIEETQRIAKLLSVGSIGTTYYSGPRAAAVLREMARRLKSLNPK